MSASDRTLAAYRATYNPRLWPMTMAGTMPADRQKAVRAISSVTTASWICVASLVATSPALSVMMFRKDGNLLEAQRATHKSTVLQKTGSCGTAWRPCVRSESPDP